MSPERKPNLLFLYADQHRADVMGCAGNDVVVTPHIASATVAGRRRLYEHAIEHALAILDGRPAPTVAPSA